MPCVTPWECVLALPRLALDKGWREEVRKNLGLAKGLGLAWEVLLEPNCAAVTGGLLHTHFAVQILLPCAEELQTGIVTEDVNKAQLARGPHAM